MCGVPTGKSWRGYLWWRLRVAQPVGQLLWWNGSHPFRVPLVSWGQQRLQLNPVTPEQTNHPRDPERKHNQSNKLSECSGVTRRKERRKRQTPGLKRRSVGRNPPGLLSPWMNTSILSLSSPTGPLPVSPHSPLAKLHLPPQKDRVRPRKEPIVVPDPSDDEPLLDQATEPKAKARKWDPTPELVVVEDDSTPLPGRQKTPKKSLPVEEETTEVLIQCLKGEARAVQYNLELAALVDYRNKSVLNLKGPPNTDDHSKYLSQVRDISWSYPAKGNLLTARQYFQELQACKNRETVEQGEAVLRDRGMLGIPQESGKSGPIKARYVILVLRSVEGNIIDARDSDYRCDWNIGLYDIVSAASTKKVEKHGQMLWKGRSVSGKVSYGYCPFCSYASTNHRTLNNHIRMHLRLSLACGMPDCWFITHSAESMWKHAATHKLHTSEPIAVYKKK